jgi:calmodulin
MPVITHKEALAVGKELGFSEDDVNLYKTQFDACDEDGGGSISSTELKSVFRACGMVMTDIEIERLVKEFDEDDTGDLDFGEFLHMMHKFQQGPSENEVRKAMFVVRARHRLIEPPPPPSLLNPPPPLPPSP